MKIASENDFEEKKLTTIEQFLKANNPIFLTKEVKQAIQHFDFEKNRLELAMMLYPYTVDQSNYYTINELFDFSSSKEKLNEFIK